MGLQDEMYKRIKEEINNDPLNIGYAGKTDGEIKNLLNTNPTTISTVVNIDVTPISRIMQGLADAPNIIDIKDVTDAKKVI